MLIKPAACVIAFVDIIAFRRHIKELERLQGEDRLTEYQRLYDALKNEMGKKPERTLADQQLGSSIEVSAFSDCTVISSSEANRDASYRVIEAACSLGVRLLEIGLFCRGGVTRGDLFHQNGIVFGPGMVRAYELESKSAIYPRVIIEDEIAEDEKLKSIYHALGGGTAPIRKADGDGLYYIDFYQRFIQSSEQSKVDKVREIVKQHLFDKEHYEYKAKWQWVSLRLEEAREAAGR